jgi:hypothetical protein
VQPLATEEALVEHSRLCPAVIHEVDGHGSERSASPKVASLNARNHRNAAQPAVSKPRTLVSGALVILLAVPTGRRLRARFVILSRRVW